MGQFYDYHPIVNLIYIAVILLMTMSTMNPYIGGISLACALIYGIYLYGLKFIKNIFFLAVPILVFAAFIIPLFSHNGVTPLFYINDLPVTAETVCYGLAMAVVLLSVIAWFMVAASMFDTEKLLYLTGRMMPAVSLVISMTLRMIPLFIKRYREVSDAQRGLGRDKKGIRFTMKKLSTVVAWSLENSVETSISMESRGYGTARRSNAHLFKFTDSDILMLIIFFLMGIFPVIMIFSGTYSVTYFPKIEISQPRLASLLSLIMMTAFMLLPLILEVTKVLISKEIGDSRENCIDREEGHNGK